MFIFFTAFYILPEKHPQIQLLSPFFCFPVFHSVGVPSVQELERFKSFVKRKPAFDVVVDGLNVANINKDKSRQSEMVQTCEAARQDETDLLRGAITSSFLWFRPICMLVPPRGGEGGWGGEFSVSCRMTNAAAHMSRSV